MKPTLQNTNDLAAQPSYRIALRVPPTPSASADKPRPRQRTIPVRASGQSPARRAVTLVELLIVIAIISILATLMLGVGAAAGETARRARTQSVITRLHALMVEHIDGYANRRVELNQSVEGALDTTFSAAQRRQRGQALADVRLYGLRELMLMEMPDRWSDVALADITAANYPAPVYLERAPSLNSLYRRRLRQLNVATNAKTGMTNTKDEILANQSAECFYLFIMNATADGEAPSLFKESEVGDTDGDGAPEFLDGWGKPIAFLRWAPSYQSDVQMNARNFLNDNDWREKAAADHDPLDIFRRDPYAYRLLPLIVSGGGDEVLGLSAPADADVPWRASLAPFSLANSLYYLKPFGDYSNRNLAGESLGSGAADNLTNHLIATRIRE
ncbi:hypothetical protein Pla175_35790 [Pirellulimonas nuda]|uniref:Type II secretion system protein G n=1 Tax=Pirellulimonas nuda TaxID=2528009 RepID=A0A518DFB6_9BACT|nr:type II secretion system protein [Pirellulimonas nuda]QDU90177.1 hypothetical protein Pla175_35790 [Pirellulimonas nuda]